MKVFVFFKKPKLFMGARSFHDNQTVIHKLEIESRPNKASNDNSLVKIHAVFHLILTTKRERCAVKEKQLE